MEGAGRFEAISVSYAAGVIAAWALGGAPAAGIVCSVALLPLVLIAARHPSWRYTPDVLLPAAFLCLGVMGYAGAVATRGAWPAFGMGWLSEAADGALGALQDRISATGVSGQTNALLRALLTGDRSLLPRETTAVFRQSGAAHILALSGLHLGIIYLVVRTVLAAAGNSPAARWVRAALAVALCGAYTFITGWRPSTVRALIYIIAAELHSLLPGRRRSPLGTLCLAAMLQLIADPLLIRDTGFQLSYLAMTGTALVFPRLRSWYPAGLRFDPLRRLWEMLSLSISCQLFTAPLVWVRFKIFPRYFLVTNLVALPLTEVLMICALMMLALGSVGLCPAFLPALCDRLADLLLLCLKAISSL